MTNPDAQLIIKSQIWNKDNVELIDYQNENAQKFFRIVNTSGTLIKKNKEIKFQIGDNLKNSEYDLVKIKRNDIGRYIINCGTVSQNLAELVDQEGVFMVYKGLTLNNLNKIKKMRLYKLSQGDIIKLGRIYLKVLEIHLNKDKQKNKETSRNTILHSSYSNSIIINNQQIIKGMYSPKVRNQKYSQILFNNNNSLLTSKKNKINNNISIDLFAKRKVMPLFPRINSSNDLFVLKKYNPKKIKLKSSIALGDLIMKKTNQNNNNNNIPKTKPVCRICYGEETNDENPLISPCICKGSLKYIHYICLRNWLNSKIEEELNDDSYENNPNCISYNRKDISCELCKVKYPDYLIHNNIYYNILFYKPIFEEYIIFESMKDSIVKNRNYHIVSLDNKDFIVLGRASECELSIPELSVSRNHCLIHKDNGKLYLEDNISKFGSLVLIQNKNMIVNDFMSLKIQVKKTYIRFKLEIPFSFSWNCCGREDTKERLDYQIQNKKAFNLMSCFVIKEDNNNILESDNNDDNEKDKKEKKEIELIDKESEVNDNKHSVKEKKEKEKENENLIDDNNIVEIVENNKLININNIGNEEKKEIEKENKNAILNVKINEDNSRTDNNINQKNNISILVNNALNNHFKKISIKRGSHANLELPKLDHINMDNISYSFLLDKNLNKINIRSDDNLIKILPNINPTDITSKNNINKKLVFPSREESKESIKIGNNNKIKK